MKNNEKWLTDEQVETEIARLKESEAVTLARYAEQLKYRRRHYLYKLRDREEGQGSVGSGHYKRNS